MFYYLLIDSMPPSGLWDNLSRFLILKRVGTVLPGEEENSNFFIYL